MFFFLVELCHSQSRSRAGGTRKLIGSPHVNRSTPTPTTWTKTARLFYFGHSGINAGLIPDLAESYTVSDDEKVYTFSLRNDAAWHNGTPVTPRDIIFTFHAIQDPSYGSPAAATFQSVSVEQVDERTVSFVLDEPFAPFLSTLTIGILPAEVWGELDPATVRLAERNLIPLGSGPYKFEELEKDRKGIVKSYTVSRFGDFYGGAPFLETITFKFYPDMDSALDALRNRRVETLPLPKSHSRWRPADLTDTPQITALFFASRAHIADTSCAWARRRKQERP